AHPAATAGKPATLAAMLATMAALNRQIAGLEAEMAPLLARTQGAKLVQIYSNCLQQHYVSLRTLSPGSIILFGRHSRADGQAAFSLDTCLIIDRFEALVPRSFLAQSY